MVRFLVHQTLQCSLLVLFIRKLNLGKTLYFGAFTVHICRVVSISAVLKARTETGRSNLTLFFFLYLPSTPTTFFLFFDSKAKLLNMDLHKGTVNINRFEKIFFLKHPSYGSCSIEMIDYFKALLCENRQIYLIVYWLNSLSSISSARPERNRKKSTLIS